MIVSFKTLLSASLYTISDTDAIFYCLCLSNSATFENIILPFSHLKEFLPNNVFILEAKIYFMLQNGL